MTSIHDNCRQVFVFLFIVLRGDTRKGTVQKRDNKILFNVSNLFVIYALHIPLGKAFIGLRSVSFFLRSPEFSFFSKYKRLCPFLFILPRSTTEFLCCDLAIRYFIFKDLRYNLHHDTHVLPIYLVLFAELISLILRDIHTEN